MTIRRGNPPGFIEVNVEAHVGYGNPITLGIPFIRMIQKGPSGCEITIGGDTLIVRESYAEIIKALQAFTPV
jgi:uncharacterized protein YlzI (FlbEa/FlbD family)